MFLKFRFIMLPDITRYELTLFHDHGTGILKRRQILMAVKLDYYIRGSKLFQVLTLRNLAYQSEILCYLVHKYVNSFYFGKIHQTTAFMLN